MLFVVAIIAVVDADAAVIAVGIFKKFIEPALPLTLIAVRCSIRYFRFVSFRFFLILLLKL